MISHPNRKVFLMLLVLQQFKKSPASIGGDLTLKIARESCRSALEKNARKEQMINHFRWMVHANLSF